MRKRHNPLGLELLETRDLLTTLPAGFAEFQVGSKLDAAPVTLKQSPDGRLFLTTDDNDSLGSIRIYENGNLLPPAVQLDIVSTGEHGMIGMTLDPNFGSNGHLYLMYTTDDGGLHNRISRFTVSGNTIDRGTELVLMDLDLVGGGTVHNGGGMAFGTDGKLYVGVGDNQVATNAEDMNTVLGKILRLNPDGSIPTDNPFYNQTTGNNRAIYGLGVRNPYTMEADPNTGRIFFNDVGPASFEEINEIKYGVDYGWPSQGSNQGAGPNNDPGFEDPIHAYLHSGDPGGCAITGGTFQRTTNPDLPAEYTDKYYFVDYCGNWMYSYDLDTGVVEEFATDLNGRPISPVADPDGTIYYASHEERTVFKIEYQASNSLQVTQQPQNTQVAVGNEATFSVTAAGTGPFTYQWQQRPSGTSVFTDISGATSQDFTLNSTSQSDDGTDYRVVVQNASETVSSSSARLTVTGGNPPVPVMNLPSSSLTYVAGDTIQFSGFATDPDESGNLPAANLAWQVTFQHDDHYHPVLGPISGQASGSFQVPTIGETSDNTWFRIHLRAVDSTGLETYIFRDVFPEKSTFTLDSNIDGIELLLDGTPVSSPTSTLGVVGVQRTIGVNSPQTINGTEYEFVGWSDGGAISHTISTPANNQTYVATFEETDDGGDHPFQIDVNDNVVIAVGTDGDDDFLLRLDDETHILTINGENFAFDAQVVDTFHLGAGATAANDQIRVVGTELDDTASAIGNRGVIRSSAYEVNTYTFDSLTFDGDEGNDLAQVFGSDDFDTLQGLPDDTTLETPDHFFRVVDFERVDSFGRGGDDYAQVYGTTAQDDFYTFDGYEVLQGPGHYQVTKGFFRVDAYGREGFDTGHLFDTVGDDHMFAFATYVVMQSDTTKSVAKGFEFVETAANRGGNDTAYLWQVSDDEHIFASGNVAAVSGDDRFVIAENFDLVDVRINDGATPSTDISEIDFVLAGVPGASGSGEPFVAARRAEGLFAGDANFDGVIDFTDFLVLADNFGKRPEGELDRVYVWEEGDFNGDGIVDFSDFLALSENFGGAR